MRIWPSQSTVIKRNVGSTVSSTTVRFKAIVLGDPRPVMDAGPAQRINAELELRAADDFQVDHVAEIVDIGS